MSDANIQLSDSFIESSGSQKQPPKTYYDTEAEEQLNRAEPVHNYLNQEYQVRSTRKKKVYLEDQLNHISEMSCSRQERSPTVSLKKPSEEQKKHGGVEPGIQEGGSKERGSKESNQKSCVKSSSCVLMIQTKTNETFMEMPDEMKASQRKYPMSPQAASNALGNDVEMEVQQILPVMDLKYLSDSQFKSRSRVTTARQGQGYFPPINYNSVTSMSHSQKSQLNSEYLALESQKCDDLKHDLD